MQSCNVCKPTSDNWYGNFKGHALKGNVSISFIQGSSMAEDICLVHGNDDCDLMYKGRDAEYKFMLIIEMKDVTMKSVIDLGFTQGY